jgi:hypothetical protein
MCMFCRSLFVRLSFFFWPLFYLPVFDLLHLITPLVSSNSSFNLNLYSLLVTWKSTSFDIRYMLKVTRNLIKYTNITFNLFYSQSQHDIEQISSFITALKDVSDFDSHAFHLSLNEWTHVHLYANLNELISNIEGNQSNSLSFNNTVIITQY